MVPSMFNVCRMRIGACNLMLHVPDSRLQGFASGPMSWCRSSWCYVDVANCSLTGPTGLVRAAPSSYFHGVELYYSYDTCGNADDFDVDGVNASTVQ